MSRFLPPASLACGVFALVLCLHPTATAQLATKTLAQPFERLTDTGEYGYATLSFDARTYAAFDDVHQAGQLAHLSDLPLPGDRVVDLLLRPVEVWEPGGTAIVVTADGREERLAPSIRLFAAYVPGRASRAFIGVSPDMLHGYLSLDGETYILSTGLEDGGPLAISHASLFDGAPGEGWSQVVAAELEPTKYFPVGAAGPAIRETEIFIECDWIIRSRLRSNQNTIDYATLLVGAISEIFRRDVGVTLTIPNGYIRVNHLVNAWQGYPGGYPAWFNSPANPLANIPRALVHLLSGPGTFCSAGAGKLCNTTAIATSGIYGSFPYPLQHTSKNNWDLYCFGHENGHVYGSQHAQNYFPPILCEDGSGPDKGTLMSYCAWLTGLWGSGRPVVRNIGMRYHERVQKKLRGSVKNKPCPSVLPIQLGDYDGNGLIDPADLAELDAFMIQGFVSLGAQETFDINQDGVVDLTDRALLVGMLIPPATSAIFNGAGANCLCYGALTQPVLGATWSTVVGNYVGQPILTVVAGAIGRLNPPLQTKFGEVLIATSGFGGQTLFVSLELTNGVAATHNNPLPYDPAFVGLTVETQAGMLKPTGFELSNGMTLFLSTY